MIDITTLTQATEIEQLESEWNNLAERADQSNFFFTFSYFKSFWQAFELKDLRIIVIKESSEIVAIAPLYLSENNSLKYIGSLDLTDYGDLIASPEKKKLALEELFKYCTQEKYTSFSLLSVSQTSLTYNYCSDLPEGNITAYLTQQEVCPIIQLPPTFEEYLTQLNRKQRHEARRKMKKLQEDIGYQVKVVSSEVSDQDIETFITLHTASSQDKADFWTPEKTDFFIKLTKSSSAKGWLRLFFLVVEGKAIATMMLFDYDDAYYLYNAGYLPSEYQGYSSGQVLLLETIKSAIDNNKKIFDFLRGDEEYKFRLGGIAQPIYDITLNIVY